MLKSSKCEIEPIIRLFSVFFNRQAFRSETAPEAGRSFQARSVKRRQPVYVIIVIIDLKCGLDVPEQFDQGTGLEHGGKGT